MNRFGHRVILFSMLMGANFATGTPANVLPSVTFAVASVDVSTNKYRTLPADVVIGTHIPGTEDCGCSHERLCADYPMRQNPFIGAVYIAFGKHKVLILSPDVIWLLIAQGFAEHVDRHAEQLRPLLVSHKDKIRLTVRRDDFVKGAKNNPWEEVFSEFCMTIAKHAKPDIHDWLVPNFSTTRQTERAAFEVTFMDSMSPYFSYNFQTLCGVPFVRLEGTPGDWEDLYKRALRLRDFGMAKWAGELEPILLQFVKASRGNVDKKFWNSIFSEGGGSGDVPHVTGWANKFFPHSPRRTIRDIDGKPTDDAVMIDEFPCGTRKVDFTWQYFDKKFPMEFVSGLVGVFHDERENSVRPVIGWAVREKRFNRDNLFLGNPIDRALLGFLPSTVLFALLFWIGRKRHIDRPVSCRISLATLPLSIFFSLWLYLFLRFGTESANLGYLSGNQWQTCGIFFFIALILVQGIIPFVGAISAVVAIVRLRRRQVKIPVIGLMCNLGLIALWWTLICHGLIYKLLYGF